MSHRALVCIVLQIVLFLSFHDQCKQCHGYVVAPRVRDRGSYQLSDGGSDFMGDIARDRVTIKSLAKLSATSAEEKIKLDQFIPPTNFEVHTGQQIKPTMYHLTSRR